MTKTNWTLRAKHLSAVIIGTGMAVTPLLFPNWVGVIAEAYQAPPTELTNNGRSALDAVFATCPSNDNGNSNDPANQAFQRDCDLIAGGFLATDPDGAKHAMNQIAADQIAAQNTAALRHMRTLVAVLSGRLEKLRFASSNGMDGDDPLAFNMYRERGGAAGDLDFGRLGAFFNLKYRTGDEDASADQAGYDFNGWGFTGGVDYRFSDDFVAGASINYLDDNVDYDDNRGDMDATTWGVNAYGTYYMDNGLYVDGLIGYGPSDYDLRRIVSYDVNGTVSSQIAKSDPDSRMFNASIGAGYDFVDADTTITPLARLEYYSNRIDGFTESFTDISTIGGAMAQTIDSTTYKSLTSHLGVQISRAFSTSYGVILPQARLGWIHEFENDQQTITARFVNDINAGSNAFFVTTNNPDRDYFDLGVAISGQFSEGRSAFISYDTLLGFDNYTYHAFNVGVRLEF